MTVTLTGSGPLDWYFDGTAGSLCDIVGSVAEHSYGYRVVGGEIQITENNNAANPNADLSEGSSAWKAILPHSSDNGHTLVAPGTPGTLHWTYVGNRITLDTTAPTIDEASHTTAFRQLQFNSAHLPYVPAIVYELGIMPTSSSMAGTMNCMFTASESIVQKSSAYGAGSYRGMGYTNIVRDRNYISDSIGIRPRAIYGSD